MDVERGPGQKFAKGNRFGKGGSRPGAGAKPSAITVLKRQYLGSKHEEAQKSFEFLVGVRNDAQNNMAIRVAAAKMIMDRVWGKEKQEVEVNRVTWVNPEGIAELPQMALPLIVEEPASTNGHAR